MRVLLVGVGFLGEALERRGRRGAGVLRAAWAPVLLGALDGK